MCASEALGWGEFLIYIISWEVLDTLVMKPKVKYTYCTVRGPGFYFGGIIVFSPCRSLSCHLGRCLIRMGTKRIMIPFGHGPVEMGGCGGASFSLSKLISLINDQQDDNPIFWKCAPASSPHWVNEDQERGVLISPDWKSKVMYVAERLLFFWR